MVVAFLALVVALGGTAFAVSGLNQKEKRQAKKIAKKQVNRLASGLSVAKANSANTAGSAATAGNAALLEGSSLAQVAPGGFALQATCSLTTSFQTCASFDLTLSRAADVAAVGTTQWYSPDAAGSSVQAHCTIRRGTASAFNLDFGSTAHRTDADQTETFATTQVFGDTPAGTHTFEFRCIEDSGNTELVQPKVLVFALTS